MPAQRHTKKLPENSLAVIAIIILKGGDYVKEYIERKYIERDLAIQAACFGADAWDGGCNAERDKKIIDYLKDIPAVDVCPVIDRKTLVDVLSEYFRAHGDFDISDDVSGFCDFLLKNLYHGAKLQAINEPPMRLYTNCPDAPYSIAVFM